VIRLLDDDRHTSLVTRHLWRVIFSWPSSSIIAALDAWQLADPLRIEPLEGGSNSHAWRVRAATELFVAKLASDIDTFEAGLLVAEYLEQAGFRAGGPIRTCTQALIVPVGEQRLALLRGGNITWIMSPSP
jgi:hypothetical protein